MLATKKKIYLLVLTFCFVDFLLFILILSPLVKRIQTNAADFNTQRNNLAVLERQESALEDFQKNVDDLKSYSQIVQSAFTDISAPVNLLEFLEEQAKNYHLSLVDSPFGSPAVEGDMWSSVGVRLEVRGKLADCLRFVEALENSRWVFSIISFDLQKNAPEKGKEGVPVSEAALSLDVKAFSGKPAVLKKNQGL